MHLMFVRAVNTIRSSVGFGYPNRVRTSCTEHHSVGVKQITVDSEYRSIPRKHDDNDDDYAAGGDDDDDDDGGGSGGDSMIFINNTMSDKRP